MSTAGEKAYSNPKIIYHDMFAGLFQSLEEVNFYFFESFSESSSKFDFVIVKLCVEAASIKWTKTCSRT